jgi:lipoprotein-anchoring transpeptidase ErfK/SrfK
VTLVGAATAPLPTARRRLAALTLGALALLAAVGGSDPVAHGAPQQTIAAVDAPAAPPDAASANRGTAIQETPTLAPPPAVLDTTPANADRSIVHVDSLQLPADSGSGRRVVYSKSIQRVWLIEADGTLYNTHRVSGRMDQPNPGTYAVWSRALTTCSNVHRNICMRWMVRFAHSFRGDNIGFHEIPRRDGVPLQTEEQLGAPLSGGCVRQSTDDAILMWNWAQLGTVVVVLP